MNDMQVQLLFEKKRLGIMKSRGENNLKRFQMTATNYGRQERTILSRILFESAHNFALVGPSEIYTYHQKWRNMCFSYFITVHPRNKSIDYSPKYYLLV